MVIFLAKVSGQDKRCSGWHLNDTSDGKLKLHDDASTIQGSPGTYFRLVEDSQALYGLGVPNNSPQNYFIDPQLTRCMRGFQSRQSLLVWKVFGQRLDGRTNSTRNDDIKYDPTTDITHTQLSLTRGLTWNEKLTIARWVDLGAPINFAAPGEPWGWFENDLRPTLWVAPTVLQASLGPAGAVTVGAYDLLSGLKPNTLSITFNVPIGGHPAGFNFVAGLRPANGGVLAVPLPQPVDLAPLGATPTVTISDNARQVTEVVRHFSPALAPILRFSMPLIWH